MRRRTLSILVATAAVLVAGMGLVLLFSTTAREAVGLAGEGGEIRLRDPLRQPRGAPRMILVAFDGVGDGELRRALQAGHLPRLAGLIGGQLDEDVYDHAYAVPDALTILPSTTIAAWTSVFTGLPPAWTGVPGNEWYQREDMRFLAPAPVTIDDHAHTLRMYSEALLGKAIRAPTLFERLDLRAHVALMPVFRGADLLTMPGAGAIGELFGALAAGLTDDRPVERQTYAALDEESVERLLESIDDHGLPDLQVLYFAGLDLYTHLAELPLPELHRYLHDIVDPALGRVLDRYAALGVLDDTYVLFVSDHGHTPVRKSEHNSLATGSDRDPPAVVERAGYRLRPFTLEVPGEPRDPGTERPRALGTQDATEAGSESERRSAADYQVVLAYQGGFAYVYVADRSSCPDPGDRCDWRLPPRLEDDVLPLVRAFDAANREGALVPELRETLDLIFARAPRPLGEHALPFQVWDGDRLVPVGEYLRRHPRPDLLDLEARLEGLAAGPYGHRAGDILLLARSGMHRPIDSRFYFSQLYHSWHGSPGAQDSRIPLVVAHTGRSGPDLRQQVDAVAGDKPSQLHIVPLVEALLKP